MEFDVYKALKQFRATLTKDWTKLTFDYEIKGDGDKEKAVATATGVSLNGLDDDITIIFAANKSGVVQFRAVFDKIDATNEVLNLVHEYNRTAYFFKMFVRDDEYLEIQQSFICYDPIDIDEYIGECMARLINTNKNELVKTLTQYTHS